MAVNINFDLIIPRNLNNRFTAGELATSNFFQIQKLQQVVSHCISREEVEKQYKDLMTIEETNKRIQKNLVVISQITDEINASQSNLLDQFHQQEMILQRKLDRSELFQLQSLVTKVVSYDEFRERAEKSLLHLSEFEKSTIHKLGDHDQSIDNVHQQLDLLNIEISKCASRRDLHILAKELKLISDKVELCATKSELDLARQQISKTLQQLETVQKELSTHRQRMNTIQDDVDSRATIKDMNDRLLITDFDTTVEHIDKQLNARPQWPITNNHQERLELLEHCQKSDSRRISVAMKFIEWFTSRGENYDHNIKILDRHLRDLISSDKTPRVHSYFIPGNRVQFTSSEVITPDLFRDQVLPPPLPGSAGDVSGTFSIAADR